MHSLENIVPLLRFPLFLNDGVAIGLTFAVLSQVRASLPVNFEQSPRLECIEHARAASYSAPF